MKKENNVTEKKADRMDRNGKEKETEKNIYGKKNARRRAGKIRNGCCRGVEARGRAGESCMTAERMNKKTPLGRRKRLFLQLRRTSGLRQRV